MGIIILIASLTLATSFLCSLFEAALYAVSPTQLEVLKKKGVRGANRLTRLRMDAEESIAAILTVNTIAHTVGAAWCGALVAEEYGDDAFGIFAAIFTFLVLALTEIVPKSVGFRFAKTIGPRIAWPLQIMVWISLPIARPARWAMRKMTGGEPQHGPSEEEILVFSRMAAKQGKVRSEEHEWVKNALRLDQTTAGSLRTPRPVVNTLPLDLTIGAAAAQQMDQAHSRMPVLEQAGSDEVVGMVYRRELLEHVIRGEQDKQLAELLHPIRHVPETMPGHALIRVFLKDRKHMVAVVDEYGSFEGIVTLEDVLEALLGEEIVDEHDEVVDMQAHARQQHRDR